MNEISFSLPNHMLGHLLEHYCNQLDMIRELRLYFHMVPHEPMLQLPSPHDMLALEAYTYIPAGCKETKNAKRQMNAPKNTPIPFYQKPIQMSVITLIDQNAFTCSNKFFRLYRTRDPYRLDSDANMRIRWHVHNHLVLPAIFNA